MQLCFYGFNYIPNSASYKSGELTVGWLSFKIESIATNLE